MIYIAHKGKEFRTQFTSPESGAGPGIKAVSPQLT